MRPVISYDDIATPQSDVPTQLGPPLPPTNQPPAKKRRTSHQKAPHNRNGSQHYQHWDDPGSNAGVMSYGDDTVTGDNMDYEEAEESRELTHEEIWDDSALIEAWNSATAEYEAYHGKGKQWKEEPSKKSPLWYNIPPKEVTSTAQDADSTTGRNSAPIDFETYIPTHDPSLAQAGTSGIRVNQESEYAQPYLANPTAPLVGQDEAFSRALSATYWAGYWTAIYHYQRSSGTQSTAANVALAADAADEEAEEDEDATDLISTER